MHPDITIDQAREQAGFAERLSLALLRRIAHGAITIHWPDGAIRRFRAEQSGPEAELHIHDARLFQRMIKGGSVAVAESYMDGDWDTPDISTLVEFGALNQHALDLALEGRVWAQLLNRLRHVFKPNSRRGARRNIAAHYDLGNEFYGEWLDSSLTYSSGVFESPNQSLTESQINKYRRIADLAGIRPGDRVLEIGCGWGGFCTWVARERKCRVDAITISERQFAFARQRVSEQGLSDRVDIRLQDYRDVVDRYDRIVSIEMLEAVGESFWPGYFEQLKQRLKPGGRAALQVITIADKYFARYRRKVDFIQKYIFPGGMLPSPATLRRLALDAGLAWDEAASHGPDYAQTLRIWHRRFDQAWSGIRALGFDDRFRRMWKYYLAYCEVGFDLGRIDVVQIGLNATPAKS